MNHRRLVNLSTLAIVALSGVLFVQSLIQSGSSSDQARASSDQASASSEQARASAEQASAGAEPATGGPTNVWDGVYTEAQAARGEPPYKAVCATCHAGQLNGTPGAPALKGGIFFQKWGDLAVSDLYGFMSTAMPPTAPGSLTSEQYIDLIAFIFSKNKFPAGENELTADLDALSMITITRKKPD